MVEIPEDEPDPSVWGQNFRGQYEAYGRTERTSDLVQYSKYGRYEGSEAFSEAYYDEIGDPPQWCYPAKACRPN